jgi:FAD/FMN-containing dehydrogenase
MTPPRPAAAPRWTNWVGNQSFRPAQRARPRSEDELATLVTQAAAAGQRVRVAGAGHSFTPVVETDGLLLEMSALTGVTATDPGRRRATVRAGTPIHGLYEPLWDAGLALRNQGDIDAQLIAGAIATATHGSGTANGCLSAVVRRVRLVTADGSVREIDETDPRLLRAAQVAVGTLGVMTELELEVTDAYRLTEDIGLWRWEDVMEQWDELVAAHRSFGFFWMPTEESGALYNLERHGDEEFADACYVKIFDEAPPDAPDSALPGHRTDRCYRIYPMVYSPNFHELEYFVALERGREALEAMRELMLASQPDAVYPLEVRTVGPDDAHLSPNHGTPTTVISVSGTPGTDYWDYLRSVDALLGQFDARVHWGKLHFLTPEQLHARYPEAQTFIDVRRELDPAGVFLNDHLRPLLA